MNDLDIQSKGSVLTIDLGALAENYRSLRTKLGGIACAGVVKADAYGLGAQRVAPVLVAEGCRDFFVATLDEAIELHDCLPSDARIWILNGLLPGSEQLAQRHDFIPVLNSIGQIERWQNLSQKLARRLPAALQIDTGMSRLGLSTLEISRLGERSELLTGLEIKLIMSHLACADFPDHPANLRQLAEFERLRHLLPEAKASLVNSSGIFLGRAFHFDLARPGVALYGANPTPYQTNPMRAVASLNARLIQTRWVEAHREVGYGLTHRCLQAQRIGVLAIGYADGWLRSLSNKGYCAYRGQLLPIIGRISMDSIIVDLAPLAEQPLPEGSFFEMLGENISLEDVARAAGTISYEILTSLGSRFFRHYSNSYR